MEVGGLAQLCALPQLQQLQLRNVEVRARQLSKLGPLPINAIEVAMEEGAEADACRWLQQSAAALREVAFCKRGPDSRDFVAKPPLLPLQHAPLLRSLTLVRMEPNLAHLAAVTQLTALGLRTCGLDDAAVLKLAGLSKLRVLELWNNKGISGAGGSMEVLAKSMPDLCVLCVGRTSAREAAWHAFGPEKVRTL